MARTMTVTIRASSICRIWPSSWIVMKERKTPARTKLTASSAPRLEREPGPAGDQPEHAMVRLAQMWPRATGPRTTATNVAPPMRTRLARRKS